MAFRKTRLLAVAGLTMLIVGGAYLALSVSRQGIALQGREAALRSPFAGEGKASSAEQRKARKSAKEIRHLADQLYEEFLAKHPEIAVTYKDVPDRENGFLRLLDFADRHDAAGGKGLSLPDDIDKMLNGSSAWNATRFAEWLRDNQGMLDEILAIGLLPEQSAKGIDPARYVSLPARTYVDMCKILRGNARALLEQGDEAAALRSLRATLGISNHMVRIETPSLLAETVAIMTRAQTWKFATEHAPSDLAAWRDALELGTASPAMLADLFRGEWHTVTRGILLPQVVSGETDFYGASLEDLDVDAFMEEHLAYYLEMSAKMRATDLAGLMKLDTAAAISGSKSEQTRSLLETLFSGSSAWSKGWVNSQCSAALMEAAFAVAMGEEVPLDRVTGKPFIIDEIQGTISMPRDPLLDDFKINPVRIPRR